MNIVYSLFVIAAPLLLLTFGALMSEYAGRLAMFLECIINLAAFFCYAFTCFTKSAVWGTVFSVCVCTALVMGLERLATKMHANMFLISLAMNLLFAALASFFSVLLFKTRGVLTSPLFSFNARFVRIVTALLCYAIFALEFFFLKNTRQGLSLRITGSDPEVLSSQGILPDRYRLLSWIFAAFNASLCGCVLCLRLSSYVPGMSGGRGWTALAAVFLGQKNPLWVVAAVFVFAAVEYASSTVQNISLFKNVPSSILLALPGLVALLLIALVPQKNESERLL